MLEKFFYLNFPNKRRTWAWALALRHSAWKFFIYVAKNTWGLTQIVLPKNAYLKFHLELNTSLLNYGRNVNFWPQKLN